MKLIVIYGPPASGKLTTAKELSKLTGYNIFHNQLTVDLLLSIIPFKHKHFQKVQEKLRLDMYKIAIKENVSLISTFCYVKKIDQKYIDKIVKLYKNKGQVHFVKLECHKDTLFKRVKHPSRKVHKKVQTKKGLKEVFKKYDLFNTIHKYRSLIIDNTKLSAKKNST
tara:strand:+ start:378 stop:878 length:501 start_codon:yes stop_codon:yes gene_type:complete